MYFPHLFLKQLGVNWKANNLDKSLKQKSTVARIFVKVSETNRNSRKIYESKNIWKCPLRYHMYFKWFLTFQRFILKVNKKAQSPKVLGCGILSPGSWGHRVPGSVSWLPGLGVPDPGVLGPWYSF